MRRIARCLFAAFVLAAAGATPASAANPDRSDAIPADLDGAVSTTNVTVHFRTSGSDGVTEAKAREAADATEQALARFVGLGFPRPLDDGDGKIDVYYYAYGPATSHGVARSDKGGATSPGFIELNPLYEFPLQTVKHELFHLVQLAVGRGREGWISEATASWARWMVDDPPAENFKYMDGPDYRYSLNCVEDAGGNCQGFGGGYTSWLYFSQFEPNLILDVLTRIGALWQADKQAHGMDALLAEFAERGLTLQGTLLNVATQMVQGTLPFPNSVGITPRTANVVVPPAKGGAASALATATVHHAALGFVAVQPEGEDCTPVPLALDVQLPSAPMAVSFVQRGGAAQPLAAGANTVPWNACGAQPAMIAVANGTLDADAQAVTVSARVATPSLTGVVVPKSVKRKPRRAFKVPVKVTASSAGTLTVAMSGGPRTTVGLKAGTNTVTLRASKAFKAKRSTLTLTPSVGAYSGTPVPRTLKVKTVRPKRKPRR